MGDCYFDNWSSAISLGASVYSVTNLVAGQNGTLEVNALAPGDAVIFAYSMTGAGPTNTPFGAVDMSQPIRQLPAVNANAAGVASLTTTIPAGAAGRSVFTQAVVFTTNTPTNSLALTIQ